MNLNLFGALGDGDHDDTDAFLLAIASAGLCRDTCGPVLGGCSPGCVCPHHLADPSIGAVTPDPPH